MKRNLQYRLAVIVAVVLLSVFLSYPPEEKINLGLDLQGGIHLVLQVKTEEAVVQEVGQVRDRMQADLVEKSISFTQVGIREDFKIEILGVSREHQTAVEDYLREYSDSWSYRTRRGEGEIDFVVGMNSAARRQSMDRTVRQAKETIQRRVDQFGVAEPSVMVYGTGEVKDQIIVELPGVDDPDRVIDLIERTAKLELKLVHPSRSGSYESRERALEAFDNSLPSDYEIVPDRGGYLVVRKIPSITGQHLKNARRSEDEITGRSQVVFWLTADGVRLFERVTEQNVGNGLAIVLDGEVRSAPTIKERIPGESASIEGQFTVEEASDLALVLRSGALPVSIEILERRSIGPSLGLDSIRSGVRASITGLTLVVVAMLIFYKLSAVNAVACLILNLIILVGALGHFEATLTLPGIAGVILTIGMAVDANVLIFERIKEELRVGKTVRSAVDAGFNRVFTTILDTNITTLIAAVVLYQTGTGPVRGFAVTLGVGLLANIFTATFVSRTFFTMFLQKREIQKLSI